MVHKSVMKTIIAGGRDLLDYQIVLDAVQKSGYNISQVISGGAKGTDSLGERYANENDISLVIYPVDWKTHGVAAGPIRNRQMAEVADSLIACWDGQSSGTKNMIQQAKTRGLKVYVHIYGKDQTNERNLDQFM